MTVEAVALEVLVVSRVTLFLAALYAVFYFASKGRAVALAHALLALGIGGFLAFGFQVPSAKFSGIAANFGTMGIILWGIWRHKQ